MTNLKRLCILLEAVMAMSFAVLLYFGGEIYRQARPIARRMGGVGAVVPFFPMVR